MGGPWKVKSDNPLIHGRDGGPWLAIAYEKVGAPNHCYRLWCFDYRETDLY